MKNSLAQANNENWTIIILPRAKHSLGVSDTGAIQSEWRGYPPGALKTMTDWAWSAIDHPSEIDKMKQEGVAPEAGILSRLAGYESLRWYGNGTIQAALWIFFLVSFTANTIAGVWCCLARLFRRQQSLALPASNRVVNLKRAICALNLLILVALTITALLVVDQMHPSCPSVLLFVPLLGTVSTLATVALLIVLARAPRDYGWTAARRIRFSLDVLCLVLFVPYMFSLEPGRFSLLMQAKVNVLGRLLQRAAKSADGVLNQDRQLRAEEIRSAKQPCGSSNTRWYSTSSAPAGSVNWVARRYQPARWYGCGMPTFSFPFSSRVSRAVGWQVPYRRRSGDRSRPPG